MDLTSIREYLAPEMHRVVTMLEASLKSDISLLNDTNAALISHGGKMIRPQLAVLVAKTCSGGHVTEDTIRYAAAAELLHNATLLHDDVADDSCVRRGRPTVMSLLGGRASVLLGDYWLVAAMDRILQVDNDSSYGVRLFSKTLKDLAEGEMLQLEKTENCDTKETEYLRIIYCKTASLFEAAAMTAAASVGADEQQRKAVRSFAVNLGIAFQIKDDIFDYQGDSSIGKPVGIDLREQKITLPLLGALKNVSKEEAGSARLKLKDLPSHPEYACGLISWVKDNDGLVYASKILNDYVDKAIFTLRALPEGKDRDAMRSMAEYFRDRRL